MPKQTPVQEAKTQPPSTGAAAGPKPMTQGAATVVSPFTLVMRLLPDGPVPVALGIGALAVAGVVEWPMVGAIGLGYLALRRWNRPVHAVQRSTPVAASS